MEEHPRRYAGGEVVFMTFMNCIIVAFFFVMGLIVYESHQSRKDERAAKSAAGAMNSYSDALDAYEKRLNQQSDRIDVLAERIHKLRPRVDNLLRQEPAAAKMMWKP